MSLPQREFLAVSEEVENSRGGEGCALLQSGLAASEAGLVEEE